ncbi:MAG: aminotransferase class III-fold pyridoxal phosphate-dependent enzyme [Gammaproteobacteria bacterium]
MISPLIVFAFALIVLAFLGPRIRSRLLLARAKHPSLQGHVRIARKIARLVPLYEFDEAQFFASDGAPDVVADQRKAGFGRLASFFRQRNPASIEAGARLAEGISDLEFIDRYRVPFQYSRHVREHLKPGVLVTASCGAVLVDLDGNESLDLTGSYGVNVLGNDFYKDCMDAGIAKVRKLGPVLGPYHPIIEDNVQKLKALSGLDEVSFHMSGTEAVMQAVRLARYHSGRSHVVRFCGAYHGWWDGVQPGIGNPGGIGDVYTLKDMDERTLKVLRNRRDIACVLVNPLQALHPNANAPADSMLVNSVRATAFDRARYGEWLRELRQVCDERGIVLIVDEIFVGFRIAYRGAQEYFGLQADLVTYGKTLGGGLPIGVVCGKSHLMKRFKQDRPLDICFARGTFNSHPYVMGAMNEFLCRTAQAEIQALYANLDTTWNSRARLVNERLAAEDLPVRVANLSTIFTVIYTQPSRYNWMLQFYLRAEGLTLGWVGTGRLIFSLDYSQQAFAEVADRFVRAARRMKEDAWWWRDPKTTNRSIRRRVLREILTSRLSGLVSMRTSQRRA